MAHRKSSRTYYGVIADGKLRHLSGSKKDCDKFCDGFAPGVGFDVKLIRAETMVQARQQLEQHVKDIAPKEAAVNA